MLAGLAGTLLMARSIGTGYAATVTNVAMHHNFIATVGKLKKLVASNGMMIMGPINQGKMLAMTGLKLKAATFFVGNPMMGKKVFSAEPGAGVALPVRITIYVAGNGKTYVSYTPPSELLEGYHNSMATQAGKMLDRKIGMLVQGLAQ